MFVFLTALRNLIDRRFIDLAQSTVRETFFSYALGTARLAAGVFDNNIVGLRATAVVVGFAFTLLFVRFTLDLATDNVNVLVLGVKSRDNGVAVFATSTPNRLVVIGVLVAGGWTTVRGVALLKNSSRCLTTLGVVVAGLVAPLFDLATDDAVG